MAHYKSEMLDFSYEASLCISHPSMSPDRISSVLKMTPKHLSRAGEPRRTPAGNRLDGTYSSSNWACSLPTTDGEDLEQFLRGVVKLLSPFRAFLVDLSTEDGYILCFLGVFTNRCCAYEFDCDLLAALGDLRVALRMDVYGSELPQKGLGVH